MARIEDGSGASLYQGRLEHLRFEEECILWLSVEFFEDPAPCEIHRSAVILRAVEEIRSACAAAEALPCSALSARIRRLLAAYPGGASIRVWEEANA